MLSSRFQIRQSSTRLVCRQDKTCPVGQTGKVAALSRQSLRVQISYGVLMDDKDKYWLAGLLEGEGSFIKGPPTAPNSPGISLQMTDEDVVARASALMGTKYHSYHRGKDKGWKEIYQTNLRGYRAVDLMRELYDLMGIRRKQQIDKAIEGYSPRYNRMYDSDIERMREMRDSGETLRGIARQFSISHERVRKLTS